MTLRFHIYSFIFFLSGICFAIPVPPTPATGAVYDEARLLSFGEVQTFNQIATALYTQANVAIALATFKNIENEEARDFAGKIAHAWKIGGKNDEGLLIFVSMNPQRRSVEVGYGAEPYLPDALVERIQQKTLVPAFRNKEYGNGVIALAFALAQEVAKEKNITLSLEGFEPIQQENRSANPFVGFIIIAILILIIIKSNKRNGPGPGGRIFIPPSSFGRSFGSGMPRRPGGFGNFGGFGGGRFGGGGSGGSW